MGRGFASRAATAVLTRSSKHAVRNCIGLTPGGSYSKTRPVRISPSRQMANGQPARQALAVSIQGGSEFAFGTQPPAGKCGRAALLACFVLRLLPTVKQLLQVPTMGCSRHGIHRPEDSPKAGRHTAVPCAKLLHSRTRRSSPPGTTGQPSCGTLTARSLFNFGPIDQPSAEFCLETHSPLPSGI